MIKRIKAVDGKKMMNALLFRMYLKLFLSLDLFIDLNVVLTILNHIFIFIKFIFSLNENSYRNIF